VRAITNSKGVTVESYTYDVYGKPTIYNTIGKEIPESQVGNDFLFTGKMFDYDTGLYYYRNRYYDPELGRFITPDPLGPTDDTNLYTYVNNNPVNLTDPYGLCYGKATASYPLWDISSYLFPGTNYCGWFKSGPGEPTSGLDWACLSHDVNLHQTGQSCINIFNSDVRGYHSIFINDALDYFYQGYSYSLGGYGYLFH